VLEKYQLKRQELQQAGTKQKNVNQITGSK
jgi:hypothetical protein